MDVYKKRKAVSMSEVLVTMGLVGILAVTMLSLNNFSDNSYQLAATKLSQVDSALKSWGKAITKTNETGLGATAVITDQQTLTSSLIDYLNTNGTQNGAQIVTNEGIAYDNADSIKLANGVVLKAVKTMPKAITYDTTVDEYSSHIAVLTAEVPYAGSKVMSEEYVLDVQGVYSIASLYEGWESAPIETVTVKGQNGEDITKTVYCTDKTKCKDGCNESNMSYCAEVAPTNCKSVYTDEVSVSSCGVGQNGSIKTYKIGDCNGVSTKTVNTCCEIPLVSQNGVCACPVNMETEPGYIQTTDVATQCKVACQAGTYQTTVSEEDLTKVCKLCEVGKYCDAEALTESITCPAGYYCPNDKTAKINGNYNTEKYVIKNKKITEVKDGGLIYKVICPKGSYCPDEGATTATLCPKGHYCPTEGLKEAIKCPAGTYQDKEGQITATACLPCTKNHYCPNPATVEPLACAEGSWSNTGATFCTGCEAGTFYNTKTKKCEVCAAGTFQSKPAQTSCEVCPKGHSCPNKGMAEPEICPCGTYQLSEGKTTCTNINIGYYPADENFEYATQGAVAAVACPEGHACFGGCNDKVKCTAGYFAGKYSASANNYIAMAKRYNPNSSAYKYYMTQAKSSPKIATTEAAVACDICPVGHYCPVDGIGLPIDCPKGNYCPNKGMKEPLECDISTYQDEEGKTYCKSCIAGHYCPHAGLEEPIACDKGFYSPQTGATKCLACPCGQYVDIKGASACKKTKAGTYWSPKDGVGLTEDNATPCSSDKYADKTEYCPAGSCKPKTGCPAYNEIYMLIDGHGYNNTLQTLIDAIKCVDGSTIPQNIKKLSGQGRIFILNKDAKGKFSYIDSGIIQTGINTLRLSRDKNKCENDASFKENSYYKVFDNFYYSGCGSITGNKSCPSAHSSSASGGTLRYITKEGVPCEYYVALLAKRVSPLILDLNSDGKDLTDVENGVKFDLDADGIIEKTSWTGIQLDFDDAFLVLDRNNNGLIDDGKELFGDQHGAENGFDELAKFDVPENGGNGDRIINKNDKVYNELQLWVDHNKNGIVDYISEEDYKLLKRQATKYSGRTDLVHNMVCENNICEYYVFTKDYVCEDKKMFGFIPYENCSVVKNFKKANVADVANGKTIELRTLDDLNIVDVSVDYTVNRDSMGNILEDENGNTIGMVGQFTQKVKVAFKDAFDALGNLLEGIIQIGDEFFTSVQKTVTDVWFVTDKQHNM